MFNKKNKNQRRNPADQSNGRIYSYYSNTRLRSDEQPNRARLKTPKARMPKINKWWRHTPSILALVAIFICLCFVLSINTQAKVIQLGQNQGVYLQSNQTYQDAATQIINKSLLNHNKVTINASSISQQMKDQFPELADVSVTVPLINRRPIIYLTASQPAIILQTNDESTLIDYRGVAILPAFQVKNQSQLKLPTIKDLSNPSIELGKPVLTTESIKFITDVNKQFQAEGLKAQQLTLPASPNELDVKLAGQKYFIKMDTTGDSREQVGAYLAVKRKLASLQDSPSQYIDVRVPGRVFYK